MNDSLSNVEMRSVCNFERRSFVPAGIHSQGQEEEIRRGKDWLTEKETINNE